jgi:hypothetical protein
VFYLEYLSRRIICPFIILILQGLSLYVSAGESFIDASKVCYSNILITREIDTLKQQGIDIAYSSALIKPWMMAPRKKHARDRLATLRAGLRQYGLELRERTGNRFMIVQELSGKKYFDTVVGGIIVDSFNGKPIHGVDVQLQGEDYEVKTSKDGCFFNNIKPGSRELGLAANSPKYDRETLNININNQFWLGKKSIKYNLASQIDEIVITASAHKLASNLLTSFEFLDKYDIENTLNFSSDVTRILHHLPLST